MDATASPIDLAHASLDIITAVLQSMSLTDRFTCALVCKAWAEAAAAATHSIILRDRVQDLSGLQRWMEKHGQQLEVLQLHACDGASLTALPCPQLQDLLLHGSLLRGLSISSSVWADIAAATKLISVSLKYMGTAPQQADVVSALTALPDLQQLTWHSDELQLCDSSLLQQLTQLTALDLLLSVAAAALQHLGSLTKLQRLCIYAAQDWAAAGCPGLQELKVLTSLDLHNVTDIPASVAQLSALQELIVSEATPAAVAGLQALTGLTKLRVINYITGPSSVSATLQLPGLRHLELGDGFIGLGTMPMSFLCKCSQLQVLKLRGFTIGGPGSLVASTTLQHMELDDCRIIAADGAAGPVSWQQVLPGSAQLPHLTSLQLTDVSPVPQETDIEHVASCCSSLQELYLDTLPSSGACPLTRLSGLTSLHLGHVDDKQCSALAQLTGLRELGVDQAEGLSHDGLRQLAALEQLTSLEFYELSDPIDLDSPETEGQLSHTASCYSHAFINKVRLEVSPEPHAAMCEVYGRVCLLLCCQ